MVPLVSPLTVADFAVGAGDRVAATVPSERVTVSLWPVMVAPPSVADGDHVTANDPDRGTTEVIIGGLGGCASKGTPGTDGRLAGPVPTLLDAVIVTW